MMKLCLFLGLALMSFPAVGANNETSVTAIASLPQCANRPKDTKSITSMSCGLPIRDKSRTYVTISNTFGALSAVLVLQRFAYKIWAGLDLGLDDWFTLVTLISGVPSTVMNAKALVTNGIGRDIWTLTPSQITNFARYFFVMELLYFFQVAALKLALLFFYMRIFPAVTVQRLLWGTVAFTALYGLVFVFAGSMQCRPVRYFWTKWDGEHSGSCINVNGLAWSNAIISIVLDCWMLAIPLWQLASLHLSLKRKICVGLMFFVGTFITVVSILRLRSLVKFGTDAMNPTWEFFGVGLWSTIEINVGIICTCMPTVRLLLVRLFPRWLGTTQPYHVKCSSMNNANSRTSSPTWRVGGFTRGVADDGTPFSKRHGVEHSDGSEAERGHVQVPEMKQARLKPSNAVELFTDVGR
ncbi:hypothetical protein E4U39_006011 [Claviceps sp. Clav50 group G5]|nr:hypothetical protein E4U39_006011 [Claviceps sp. Clav50 group G5]